LHKTCISRSRIYQPLLFATPPSALSISVDDSEKAYQYWLSLNSRMPVTAPSYLTRESCNIKFQNLVKAVNSVEGALAIMNNDASVLRFREETIAQSYEAWVRKLDGDSSKALDLVIRAPMILAIKAKAVDQGELGQTIFFSYVTVVFRAPTKALQMLLKNVI